MHHASSHPGAARPQIKEDKGTEAQTDIQLPVEAQKEQSPGASQANDLRGPGDLWTVMLDSRVRSNPGELDDDPVVKPGRRQHVLAG